MPVFKMKRIKLSKSKSLIQLITFDISEYDAFMKKRAKIPWQWCFNTTRWTVALTIIMSKKGLMEFCTGARTNVFT